MITNPEEFHLMFLSANKKDLTINIRGISLKSEANFTLLGVDINNCLSFHDHINKLFREAANQINAPKRLSLLMRMAEKAILIKSFILSNFNYCPLVWHLCSKRDIDKMEKIQTKSYENGP